MSTTVQAIGLSGFASTGKTTAANYIEARYGYVRQHIAEPMRRMLASLMRDAGYSDDAIEMYLVGEGKESYIPRIGASSRHCQVTLGTEWGRKCIGEDLWSNLWTRQAETAGGKRMNDSVRFANEESAVRRCGGGGFTILIRRSGYGPAVFKWGAFGRTLYRWFGVMWGVHDSERTDRLSPDFIIDNDGTLAELHEKIDKAILKGLLRVHHARKTSATSSGN